MSDSVKKSHSDMSLYLAATAKYIATKIWRSLRVENYVFKMNKILANSLEFL